MYDPTFFKSLLFDTRKPVLFLHQDSDYQSYLQIQFTGYQIIDHGDYITGVYIGGEKWMRFSYGFSRGDNYPTLESALRAAYEDSNITKADALIVMTYPLISISNKIIEIPTRWGDVSKNNTKKQIVGITLQGENDRVGLAPATKREM